MERETSFEPTSYSPLPGSLLRQRHADRESMTGLFHVAGLVGGDRDDTGRRVG